MQPLAIAWCENKKIEMVFLKLITKKGKKPLSTEVVLFAVLYTENCITFIHTVSIRSIRNFLTENWLWLQEYPIMARYTQFSSWLLVQPRISDLGTDDDVSHFFGGPSLLPQIHLICLVNFLVHEENAPL